MGGAMPLKPQAKPQANHRQTTGKEDSMPGKKPGPSIKRPKTYEALKKKGMSKTRAAKISNAQAKKA